jgi:ribose transport system ATP-binding protein
MKDEILRLDKVTRIVDGLTLLDNFNLHIFQGEIMGLVCINAHGQKELVELLCQNLPIHYGRIYFNEAMVNNYAHSSLSINKVSVIEKRSRLVEDLTVVDNIFVLRRGFKKYFISNNMLNRQLKMYTKELDIDIDGNEIILNLTSFEKSVVELLKAVVLGVKLIIIKDISNSISAADLVKFKKILKYYCKLGFSFLYICNHHEEAFKMCNRISFMENGKILKVLHETEFTTKKVQPYFIDYFNDYPKSKTNKKLKRGVLEFQNVYTDNLKNMNFSIEKGSCVAILDMNNTVLNDIVQLMNGQLTPKQGNIFLDGSIFSKQKTAKFLKQGVGFIAENPIQSMIFKEMTCLENLCFLVDEKKGQMKLNKRIKKSIIQEYEPLIGKEIYENNIMSLRAATLYSIIYYRFHLFNPKVVFCIQPFYGADMYLRRHIIKLISELKQKGITVIILAVNISDSLMVADSLVIIEEGHFSREYDAEEFDFFSQEATLGRLH